MKLSRIAEPDNLAVIFNIANCSSTTALLGFNPSSDESVRQLQSILLTQFVVIQSAQSFVRQNKSCDLTLLRKIKLSLVKLVAKEIDSIDSTQKPLAIILARELKPTERVGNENLSALMNILSAFPELTEKMVRELVCPLFDWFDSAVSECTRYITRTEIFVELIQGDFFVDDANTAVRRKARKAKATAADSKGTAV